MLALKNSFYFIFSLMFATVFFERAHASCIEDFLQEPKTQVRKNQMSDDSISTMVEKYPHCPFLIAEEGYSEDKLINNWSALMVFLQNTGPSGEKEFALQMTIKIDELDNFIFYTDPVDFPSKLIPVAKKIVRTQLDYLNQNFSLEAQTHEKIRILLNKHAKS